MQSFWHGFEKRALEEDKKALAAKWRGLVNMGPGELKSFLASEEGRSAGLSRSEASSQGIRRGRDSGFAIVKMKGKAPESWTPSEWAWAKRQVNFITRMKGNPGPLYDDKGRKTRKHTSLLIWGHDPAK